MNDIKKLKKEILELKKEILELKKDKTQLLFELQISEEDLKKMIKQCYNCNNKDDCKLFRIHGNTICNSYTKIIKLYNNEKVIVEKYYHLYGLVDISIKNKTLTVDMEALS